MKNLFRITLFLLSLSLVANELEWVDEQIEAIKPPRAGIAKSKIDLSENPFIFLSKKTKKKRVSKRRYVKSKKNIISKAVKTVDHKAPAFSLDAIINKSALIDGNWYKVDTNIGKYLITNINKTTVTLSYKKRDYQLSTRSKIRRLKFRNN